MLQPLSNVVPAPFQPGGLIRRCAAAGPTQLLTLAAQWVFRTPFMGAAKYVPDDEAHFLRNALDLYHAS